MKPVTYPGPVSISRVSRCAVIVGAVGVLAGCGAAGSPWSSEPINTLAIGDAPDFPQDLDHWTLQGQWSDQPRAFVGQWTDVIGPNYNEFPVAMNGCSSGRFLIRWRAVDGDSVVAAQVDDEGTVGKQVSGSAGWMDLDACSAPTFTLAEDLPNGGNLADVTVQVQQYFPAP